MIISDLDLRNELKRIKKKYLKGYKIGNWRLIIEHNHVMLQVDYIDSANLDKHFNLDL